MNNFICFAKQSLIAGFIIVNGSRAQPVDIETHMGLSYKHLNDVFKKETGITLQKYHCQMRMERAARLLQQTDLTITQISERLGFDEVFYFSNVFKKQMKLSPISYRKKCVRI